jgi:hypothetical protein
MELNSFGLEGGIPISARVVTVLAVSPGHQVEKRDVASWSEVRERRSFNPFVSIKLTHSPDVLIYTIVRGS